MLNLVESRSCAVDFHIVNNYTTSIEVRMAEVRGVVTWNRKRTMNSRRVKPTNVVMFLVILINHKKVDSLIVQGPSDTTAVVNESTYFNCSTSIQPISEQSIIWFHFPLDGGGQRNYVYDDGRIMTNYKNRFAIDIDLSSGKFNLLILRLEPKDAGKYECRDDVHADLGASAELTILASKLVCESHTDPGDIIGPTQCNRPITPDKVQLYCGVTYSAKNAPRMVWRKSGDSVSSAKTDCMTTDSRVTCNTTLSAANLQLSGSVYYCELTTQRYNCSLEIRNISYVFRGNTTVNVGIDEEVKCSANSSQSCSYKWKWFSGSDSLTVSTDQTLKPTRVGSHRCEATCPIIGNTSCVVDVMFAEVYSTEATTGQLYLWILLSLLLILALIITVIVVLYWRHKRAKKRFSTSQEVETNKTDQSTPLVVFRAEVNEEVTHSEPESNKAPTEELYHTETTPAQVEVPSSFDIRCQSEDCSADEADTDWYAKIFNRHTNALDVALKQMTRDRQESILEMMNSKKAYPLTKKDGCFGRAVIINNMHYFYLNPRPGSDVDCEQLKKLFEQLHFEPVIHTDLTAEEMQKILVDETNNEKHHEYSCFVLCILAHGSENKVYGIDNCENYSGGINIREIISLFTTVNCPGLAGKPKLFFIGAGQGDAQSETASRQQISKESTSQSLHTPDVADVLVAYSAAPGCDAWRNVELGSWFIRCLVYVILKNACEDHIVDMLTQVTYILSQFKVEKNNRYAVRIPYYGVQVPQIVSTLTKKVYFMP